MLEEIAALTADSLPEGTVSWPAERDVMVDLLMAINCNQVSVRIRNMFLSCVVCCETRRSVFRTALFFGGEYFLSVLARVLPLF